MTAVFLFPGLLRVCESKVVCLCIVCSSVDCIRVFVVECTDTLWCVVGVALHQSLF